jgi:hypothetical protein
MTWGKNIKWFLMNVLPNFFNPFKWFKKDELIETGSKTVFVKKIDGKNDPN